MERAQRFAATTAVAALIATLSACDLINPDEQVPAYLQLAAFDYSAGIPTAAPNASIPSAFVYADGQLLGIFNLPVKVPVLREGVVRFNIRPAISADGQRGTRVGYPFYRDFITTQNLTPGQTIAILPQTSLDPDKVDASFVVSDDFTSTISGDRAFAPPISTSPYTQESAVSDATRSNFGRVQGITGSTDVFYLDSNWEGALPQKGATVYLELDYRSTMPFQVGVAYTTAPGPGAVRTRVADLTVFPKEEWSKLYVNLTDEISYVNNDGAFFKIYLEGLPTGDAGQYLAIDNVRLVRPK
jgi:hypothetical protein